MISHISTHDVRTYKRDSIDGVIIIIKKNYKKDDEEKEI